MSHRSHSVEKSIDELLEESLRAVRTGESQAEFEIETSEQTSSQMATDLLLLLQKTQPSQAQFGQFGQAERGLSGLSGLSGLEAAVLRSKQPLTIEETEEVVAQGERGIYLNRAEAAEWRGDLALSEYRLNEDASPELVLKQSLERVEYVQELAVRYLRPPTPQVPGEIVITQEPAVVPGPAPPLIIRQQPARSATPEPLVVREAPPPQPRPVAPKRITIAGKRLPPPPRKVVIERLATLPAKPQPVIVERWLPYREMKRRVVFHKAAAPPPVVVKPRNIIVQWEAPQAIIRKEVKHLGVVRANPAEYRERYGNTLKASADLPQFVCDIPTPAELGPLACDFRSRAVPELEGEVQALGLVDLEREGLAEYRAQLAHWQQQQQQQTTTTTRRASEAKSKEAPSAKELIARIFAQIDKDGDGTLSQEEATSLLLRINSRLGRSYGQREVDDFFAALDKNRDGLIDVREFHEAFIKLLNL